MGDILSADEIQALLASYSGDADAGESSKATEATPPAAKALVSAGVQKSAAAAAPRSDTAGSSPALFGPPDAISRGKRAALENGLRRAADRMKTSLESWLGSDVHGKLGAFGLARDVAPSGTESVTRFLLAIRGEQDEGAAAIELQLAASLVRSKLRMTRESGERPLTEVEMAILEAEASTLVASMSEATEPLLGTSFALGGRLREANEGPLESTLLWARFEFGWEGTAGRMWIGLPSKALRARVEGTSKAPKLEPKDLGERWVRLLEPVRIPVAVLLGRAVVSVEELVRMQVGDVLVLEGEITDAMDLSSGAFAIHSGRLGQFHGKWTFRVDRKSERTNATGGKS